MRSLFAFTLVVAILVVVGCSSNNSNSITGPSALSAQLSGSVTPSLPTITPNAGIFGTISNLDLGAGTFTLTSPSGTAVDVTTSSTTMVLYEGSLTDVGTSVLKNGEQVTVAGGAAGLPEQAKVRAQLIIINSSALNQEAISAD